jgi:hypothetical protein
MSSDFSARGPSLSAVDAWFDDAPPCVLRVVIVTAHEDGGVKQRSKEAPWVPSSM